MERTVSLVSFNLFGGMCIQSQQSAYQLPFCDFICTQEDDSKHSFLLPFKQECGTGSEKVAVYSLSQVPIHCITTESTIPNVPNRHAVLVRYDTFLIANVHLEGGRFSDKLLLTLGQPLLSYKLSLLIQVLAYEPHVILGDFNSVFCADPTRVEEWMQQQFQYFQSIYKRPLTEIELQLIRDWNQSPYQLLTDRGYSYAVPSNENMHSTNGRGKTIIDGMWFKNVILSECKIISSMEPSDRYNELKCISDHNPIFAKFRVQVSEEFKTNWNKPWVNRIPNKLHFIRQLIAYLENLLPLIQDLETEVTEQFIQLVPQDRIKDEFYDLDTKLFVDQQWERIEYQMIDIESQWNAFVMSIDNDLYKPIVWPTKENVILSLLEYSIVQFQNSILQRIDSYKEDISYFFQNSKRILNEFSFKKTQDIPPLGILPRLGSSLCHQTTYHLDELEQERFNLRPVVQAFHATDMKSLIAIVESGQMICGQGGKFGPGIYFCPRPTDCIIKSLQPPEVLLDVDLYLGKTHVLFGNELFGNRDAYDSIIYTKQRDNTPPPLFTGYEFMVFRTQQVTIKGIYLLSNTKLEKGRLLRRFNIRNSSSNMNELRYQSFDQMNRMVKGGWNFISIPFEFEARERQQLNLVHVYLNSVHEIGLIEPPNEIKEILLHYEHFETPIVKEDLEKIVSSRYESILKSSLGDFSHDKIIDRSYFCPIPHCRFPFHHHLEDPKTTLNLMGKKKRRSKHKK